MEPNGTNENRVPAVPCRSGCGFYGSIACEGFCSKCYTDLVKSRHDNARAEKMGESSSSMESPSSGRVQSAGEIKHQQDRSEGADICEALRRASVSEKESAAAAESAESLAHSSADSATNNATSAVTAAVQLKPALSDTAAAAPDKSAGGGVAEDADISSESKSKKKNRCNTCNKRVGLTGFPCRCGGLYCSMHRYSDTHACTFNYKELAQEDIRKNNPVVVAEKIKKI